MKTSVPRSPVPSPMTVETGTPKGTAIVAVKTGPVEPGSAEVQPDPHRRICIGIRVGIRNRNDTGRHRWLSQLLLKLGRRYGLTISLSSELSHYILLCLQLAFEFSYLLPLLLDKGVEASRLRILAVI